MDHIRDSLFGDVPLDQWPPPGAPEGFPWSAFTRARSELAHGDRASAIASWRSVLAGTDLESRHYLQAWYFLRQHGEAPEPVIAKRVLGVVVEIALPGGLDVLAAYADHHARYYNFSGSGVVWDHPDDSLDATVDELLAASSPVVSLIGPWNAPRPAIPQRGNTRLSFLTPSGLHFGEGPIGVSHQRSTRGWRTRDGYSVNAEADREQVTAQPRMPVFVNDIRGVAA